jgi:hypothetical protein
MAASSYWPLWQLTISRMRIFYREPAAVFWVYGFPLVMALSLGTAFRDNPKELITVDVVQRLDGGASSDGTERLDVDEFAKRIASDSRFKVVKSPAEDWRKRLQAGKTDLVIEVGSSSSLQFWDEPHRVESRLARHAVEAQGIKNRDGCACARRKASHALGWDSPPARTRATRTTSCAPIALSARRRQ